MIVTNVLALVLTAALNPLVARAPDPRGDTPADCEVSGAAPMPRITVAQADPVFEDEPAMPPPPVRSTAKVPAATTSADVSELKRALATNDRAAFDVALARAKADGVATRVYDDIARLWDAQFQSPFFAEDSDAHRVARSYPGYEEAVRRQVYTDARGQKFYPAAESRAFVATHVGMRAPATRGVSDARPRATSPRTTTSTTTTKSPSNTGSTKTANSTRSTKTANRTRSTSTASNTRPTKTASREPVASRKNASPRSSDPSASPRVAATAPAPVASKKAVDTSTTEAPPDAGIFEPEPESDQESDPVPPASDTAVTETAVTETTATDTTLTDATATDTDTAAATPAQTTTTSAKTGATRPILIPAILILIGLGVLILLFRTKA